MQAWSMAEAWVTGTGEGAAAMAGLGRRGMEARVAAMEGGAGVTGVMVGEARARAAWQAWTMVGVAGTVVGEVMARMVVEGGGGDV